jgi:hypothetical protein
MMIKLAIVAITTVAAAFGPFPRLHAATPHAACTVIAGYWIRDTRTNQVFYKDAGDLTQGEFVGYGGPWVIVQPVCARSSR